MRQDNIVQRKEYILKFVYTGTLCDHLVSESWIPGVLYQSVLKESL